MESRDQIMNKGKRRGVKVKGTKRKNFTSPQAIALRENLKNGEQRGKRLALCHITYFFTLLHVKTNRPQETQVANNVGHIIHDVWGSCSCGWEWVPQVGAVGVIYPSRTTMWLWENMLKLQKFWQSRCKMWMTISFRCQLLCTGHMSRQREASFRTLSALKPNKIAPSVQQGILTSLGSVMRGSVGIKCHVVWCIFMILTMLMS